MTEWFKLDVTAQAEILDLLRDLRGRLGIGILPTTHHMGVGPTWPTGSWCCTSGFMPTYDTFVISGSSKLLRQN
jgi:ABC-type uncharacterized transport system ATPase subunit